jgi:hypothetical protein
MYMASHDAAIPVQGNCTDEPDATLLGVLSGAPLAERLPGQCVIVTDVRWLQTAEGLWLDSLLIRHQTGAAREARNQLLICESVCKLWMTDVTLQGDGQAKEKSSSGDWINISGLNVFSGQLYAAGVVPARTEEP